jgi:hypothetical protein
MLRIVCGGEGCLLEDSGEFIEVVDGRIAERCSDLLEGGLSAFPRGGSCQGLQEATCQIEGQDLGHIELERRDSRAGLQLP